MKLTVREVAVFSMLGAIMYISKIIMDLLPNIHLIGVLITAYTVVYGKKALCPIYIYVFLTGLLNGFGTWWLPYLYIWAVLWGAVMLVPEQLSENKKQIIRIILCSLHGFLYGVLYAPAQALIFGLNFKQTIAWVIAGLPFDAIHGVSNLLCGFLITPIVYVLKRLEKRS